MFASGPPFGHSLGTKGKWLPYLIIDTKSGYLVWRGRLRARGMVLVLRYTALRIGDVVLPARDRISTDGNRWRILVLIRQRRSRRQLGFEHERLYASVVGRFFGVPHWPVLGVPRGNTDSPSRYQRKIERTHSASSALITSRPFSESRL